MKNITLPQNFGQATDERPFVALSWRSLRELRPGGRAQRVEIHAKAPAPVTHTGTKDRSNRPG